MPEEILQDGDSFLRTPHNTFATGAAVQLDPHLIAAALHCTSDFISPTSYASSTSAPSPSEQELSATPSGALAPDANGTFDLSDAHSYNDRRIRQNVIESTTYRAGDLRQVNSFSERESQVLSASLPTVAKLKPTVEDILDNASVPTISADRLILEASHDVGNHGTQEASFHQLRGTNQSFNDKIHRDHSGHRNVCNNNIAPNSQKKFLLSVDQCALDTSAAQQKHAFQADEWRHIDHYNEYDECPEIMTYGTLGPDSFEATQAEAVPVDDDNVTVARDYDKDYLDEAFEVEEEAECRGIENSQGSCETRTRAISSSVSSSPRHTSTADVHTNTKQRAAGDCPGLNSVSAPGRDTANHASPRNDTAGVANARACAMRMQDKRPVPPKPRDAKEGKGKLPRLRKKTKAKQRCTSAPNTKTVPKSARTLVVEDEKETNGFLCPFLIASGINAPRAVRMTAQLKSANVHNPQQLIRMKSSLCERCGLSMAEGRKLLEFARVAVKSTSTKTNLPKIRGESTVRQSKSAQDELKPRKDPTTWAKERRARILSAKRRRELRLTE